MTIINRFASIHVCVRHISSSLHWFNGLSFCFNLHVFAIRNFPKAKGHFSLIQYHWNITSTHFSFKNDRSSSLSLLLTWYTWLKVKSSGRQENYREERQKISSKSWNCLYEQRTHSPFDGHLTDSTRSLIDLLHVFAPFEWNNSDCK